MKGKYRRKSCWCPGCDKVWLEIGKKCPMCGTRMRKPKIKYNSKGLENKDWKEKENEMSNM